MTDTSTEDPGASLSPVEREEVLRVLAMAASLLDDDGPGPWPDVDTVEAAIKNLAARLRAPVASTLPVEMDEVLRVLDEFAWVTKWSPEPVTDTYTYTIKADIFRDARDLAARLRAPVAPAPIEPGEGDALVAALPKPAPAPADPCLPGQGTTPPFAIPRDPNFRAPAPSRGLLDKIATDDLKTELEYRLGASAPADEKADFEQAAHKAFAAGVIRRVVAPAPADTVPVSREWLKNLRADPWSRLTYIEAEIDRLLAEGARR